MLVSRFFIRFCVTLQRTASTKNVFAEEVSAEKHSAEKLHLQKTQWCASGRPGAPPSAAILKRRTCCSDRRCSSRLTTVFLHAAHGSRHKAEIRTGFSQAPNRQLIIAERGPRITKGSSFCPAQKRADRAIGRADKTPRALFLCMYSSSRSTRR